MKNIFLVLSLLLCSTLLNGQCKFEKNETDEFEGSKVLITQKQSIWGKLKEGAFEFYISAINKSVSINCLLHISEVSSIAKGDKCIMILGNGDKINLLSKENDIAEYKIISSQTFWELSALYQISLENLSTINKHGLEAIRFYYKDGYKEFHLKKKSRLKIEKLVDCIKKEIKTSH